MLHTANEEFNHHDKSERMVGIHVFLHIPKFNRVGSFIFFFSMISFGYVQKISWVKLDTLVKSFSLLKALNDQLHLQVFGYPYKWLNMTRHNLITVLLVQRLRFPPNILEVLGLNPGQVN